MNPIQYFLWGNNPIKPEFHIDLVHNPNKTGVYQFDFNENGYTNMTFYMSDNSPIFFKSHYSLHPTIESLVYFNRFEELVRNYQSFKIAHCNKFMFSVIIQKLNGQTPAFNYREVRVEIGKEILFHDQGILFYSNNKGNNVYELEFTLLTSSIIITEFFKRFVVILPTS